ncbi:Por secretion system C-terminal sorting domain-containing protein [Chryseobacterium sp. RU37D]|uniref:T9SS type A sorting domain-containing protein n=1 Tax=Chryseobacterium sp. RU37D TaxID=1907397 RepID=UPI0009566071|nr:T9SS type A sorting domain-containing protein [Chryseobacterium sp. RU37D]SIQ49151.1 Por secretion system C-terminal sorting domain-containing protein [Chryseobacterium sp. RU37D]
MTKFLLSCLLFLSMNFSAQIDLGTGSTEVGEAPISTYYGYSYVQQIFTKQEINANAAGNITGLKFYLDPAMSIANSSQWIVYLGQTSKSSFTSASDWIPLSELTQVFSGTVTNNNGVIEVSFATPFPYNNTSNLVIAAEENSAGYDANNYDEAMYVYTGAPNSTIYYKNDYTDPDPASPPATDGNLANFKSVVTILGLTASSIPPCPSITYPANNATFVPLSATLTWNNSSGATGYKVSIGTTPGGTDVANQVPVTTNSYTPTTAFTPNTMLYLTVTAVGPGGESSGCMQVMFKTAPPPPTNDECATATTLTVNPDTNCGTVTPGYTIGATDSGTVPDPCYGTADDDVWYKFVATATSHKISLLNIQSIGTNVDDTDTYFQVFSGGCGALSSILCSDPPSGVVSGLTVGETYLVRVYSYNDSGSNQSFDICVGTFPPPPANDECFGAFVANTFPYTYIQNDAAGATNNSGMITACSNNDMNDGTWFSFVGDGDTFNITVTMPAGSDFDPQIGVFSGSCSALSCEATVDNAGQGGTETLSIPTLAGNTYYVNVGYYSGSSDELEGPFTIDITKGVLAASEVKSNKNAIKLYPNPFSEVLNISDAANVKSVSVSDVSGRLIKAIDNPGSELHLGELKQGIYMITLHMKDGSKQTIKTIKK